MTEVLSIRLDDELYRSLKETDNYQDALKEYIRFFVETKGKSSSSVKDFLNSILYGKDVKSPAFLTIIMLAKGVEYSDIKKTVDRATEKNEEAIIASNMIVEKWDKIIKATSEQSSFLKDTLSIELRKRSDYYQFLSTTREEMEKLEIAHPDVFYAIAEHIETNGPTNNMFYQDRIEYHLKRIFGEDVYESTIRGFFKSGAANIYSHNARKNHWIAMEFNDIGRKNLEEIRNKKVEEITKRMENEISDNLFNIIRLFIDTRGSKPYKKSISQEEASQSLENLDKLVMDKWILVEGDEYGGYCTYLSPTSMSIIEGYALKRI